MWFSKLRLSQIERLSAQGKTASLMPLLNDQREFIRLAAIRALGGCRDDAAYDILTTLIQHSEAAVRKNAVLALADMNRAEGRFRIEQQRNVEKDANVLSIIETVLFRLKNQ